MSTDPDQHTINQKILGIIEELHKVVQAMSAEIDQLKEDKEALEIRLRAVEFKMRGK